VSIQASDGLGIGSLAAMWGSRTSAPLHGIDTLFRTARDYECCLSRTIRSGGTQKNAPGLLWQEQQCTECGRLPAPTKAGGTAANFQCKAL